MDVTSVGSSQVSPISSQSIDDKRTALQAMLLKKSLEAQLQQASQVANAIEGKGKIIDVRV